MRVLELTCQYCGKTFEASRQSAKFCSDNCRAKSHKKQKRGKNHTVAGLTEGEKLALDNIAIWSPKTANQLRALIQVKGVKAVKPVMPIFLQFLADTGKLNVVMSNGGVGHK